MSIDRLFPRLVVADGDRAVEFYQRAFGATLGSCFRGADGKIVHAELALGQVVFHLKDADPYDSAPEGDRSGGILLNLYTDDVDALWAQVVAAGAEVVFPLETWFYGERGGRIRDPFGHQWSLSTIVEQLTPEELQRRTAQWSAGS